jgi:hypothetical protein
MSTIKNSILAPALAATFSMAPAGVADNPFLAAATYAGGPGNDIAKAMDIGPDGSIFIAGYTTSPGLPNAIGSLSGSMDIFVMKLSGDLTTLHWSAYIGGVGQFHHLEFATDCAATPDGGVVVTGKTETPDFPTLNAIDDTLGGPSDAVLFKLDAEGQLVFSTYIGGSGGENGHGAGLGKFIGEVEVAPDGAIFLAGNTRSADFPLVNPIDGTFGGFQDDVFFMKISADGQTILASTYLGDEYRDEVWGMRLDADGRPVIIGNGGPGWPYTPGAYSFGTPSSNGVVFVTKLAADAQSIVWSGRLDRVDASGGHLTFTELAINTKGDGAITVVGDATGGGFPVPPNAYQPSITPGSPTRDAVAFSFSADGTHLTAGTFLGVANVGEIAAAVGVDSYGQILLPINIVTSPPNPNRFYKLNAEMTALVAGPFMLTNPGQAQMARTEDDNNFVALAIGSGLTTPGAFQEQHPGGGAAYVARWDMQDPPMTAHPSDINGDGVVDVLDLLILLDAWGACKSCDCPADLNGDCAIDVLDLLFLLDNWG